MSTIGEMRFSPDHFWVRLDDETQATIGLTDYLQEKLGEIYGLRLPEEGEEFIKDEPFSMIEAKNGRRELRAPISGEVIEYLGPWLVSMMTRRLFRPGHSTSRQLQ